MRRPQNVRLLLLTVLGNGISHQHDLPLIRNHEQRWDVFSVFHALFLNEVTSKKEKKQICNVSG